MVETVCMDKPDAKPAIPPLQSSTASDEPRPSLLENMSSSSGSRLSLAVATQRLQQLRHSTKRLMKMATSKSLFQQTRRRKDSDHNVNVNADEVGIATRLIELREKARARRQRTTGTHFLVSAVIFVALQVCHRYVRHNSNHAVTSAECPGPTPLCGLAHIASSAWPSLP